MMNRKRNDMQDVVTGIMTDNEMVGEEPQE
jgi:hypothetical protein